MGDAILSSCCYREYKKANPELKISVACYGSATAYLQNNKYIDVIYKIPARRVIRPNQRWIGLILLGLRLRIKNFDLIIDSSAKDFLNWRLFKLLAGRGREINASCLSGDFFKKPFHAQELEKEIAKLLIKHDIDSSYDLPVEPETEQKINSLLEEKGISEYILLNLFGSIEARSFNQETFDKITKQIITKNPNAQIVIPGMPAQIERVKTWAQIKNSFLFKTANVFELFELIKRSSLVITPDTAIIHIASGYKIKTIGFYNAYSAYNAPYNTQSKIVITDKNSVNNFKTQDFTLAYEQI